MRRVAHALIATAVAALALGMLAVPAGAQVTGGCVVTVNGENVNRAHSPGTAFEFEEGDVIRVVGTSTAPVDSYEITAKYGLFSYPAKSGEPTGDDLEWSGEVKVSDYTRLGVGLYRFDGSSTGAAPCSGWAYIKINGPFPLATVAGGAAAVITVVGVAGMASATRPPKGGKPGRGHRWRGSLVGLLAGAGAAVLLQQFGVVPMTPAVMVGVPAGTGLVGLALGWPNLFGNAAAAAA
jgi:hypothetical protein